MSPQVQTQFQASPRFQTPTPDQALPQVQSARELMDNLDKSLRRDRIKLEHKMQRTQLRQQQEKENLELK